MQQQGANRCQKQRDGLKAKCMEKWLTSKNKELTAAKNKGMG